MEFNQFEFCFPPLWLVTITRLKNLVCLTIIPIAEGRVVGFIPFPRVLALCEMQTTSSRIWTWVTVFIYDIHYTMSVSKLLWSHGIFTVNCEIEKFWLALVRRDLIPNLMAIESGLYMSTSKLAYNIIYFYIHINI